MNPRSDNIPDATVHAQRRRARLIERLADDGLAGALITDPRDIAYFTACPLGTPTPIPACLLIHSSGESVLVRGEADAEHRVDMTVTYRWHEGGTISTQLVRRLVEHAEPRLRLAGARVGVQFESITAQMVSGLGLGSIASIDRAVLDLERSKDPLDLFRIKGAIDANLAAFDAVAAVIAPGANELEVFAAGSRGAMLRAGERIVHDGDYRCGAPGGPCRDHRIQSGELYIIDAWTHKAGYWSDLARTFPVGTPTGSQLALIRHVRGVHHAIQTLLRPGTTGHDLWSAMDAALREHPALAKSGLVHHGGHGVGVRLHEAPDLNPGVTDALREGDVVCIEPGAYTPNANVRIEETYLITADGAVCLSGVAEA
ncbi:MAG: aminopeptidase P family protein [Planctomycetes bacterium]|nr:aminopeptidase P family protein [Planctomycetota bacterium]